MSRNWLVDLEGLVATGQNGAVVKEHQSSVVYFNTLGTKLEKGKVQGEFDMLSPLLWERGRVAPLLLSIISN